MKFNFQTLLLCTCPPAAAVTTIPTDDCKEQLGQIQRIGLQRTTDGTTLNEIVIATNDPTLLATWTALTGAVDNTKVQYTPLFANPTNEAGAKREFGSGNTVLNGVPENIGREASPFSAEFYNKKQAIAAALKDYECETALSVFLVNEHKQIIGLVDDLTTPTKFRGIPIQAFFISDKQLGNYEEPDRNFINFSFQQNWSDYLYIVTPVFDPLVEL